MKPKALVTAGPTYEAIDPVRFIGNRSSGKMGYLIAQELEKAGFEVILISGPTNLAKPTNIHFVQVESAKEMYEACLKEYKLVKVAVFAAAVADYTPKVVASEKIKKNEDSFSIELIKTKDIAKEMGLLKSDNQLNIGFALETNNEEGNAKKKLVNKNFDFIVLNSLKNENTCFGSDHNKISIFEHNKIINFEFKTKDEVAKDIVKHIVSKL
jgi:phosphopantothenoylcysteine decarboxylase / phosphopantothenate---cysteine ligase